MILSEMVLCIIYHFKGGIFNCYFNKLLLIIDVIKGYLGNNYEYRNYEY